MSLQHPVPRTTDLDGPFSWVDHGGPSDGHVVVAVHGLSGSHVSWNDLGPLLSRSCRVLAVDLAGHGRTPRAGRSAAVTGNAALLGRFVREVVQRPVVLLGSSMGAAVSVLHAAADPAGVAGLALIGPALPRTAFDVPGPALARQVARYAVPALAERSLSRRRARLGAEEFVQATLELTCADPSRVSPQTRELAVRLHEETAGWPDADAALVEAARSVGRLVAAARTYRGVLRSVRAPGLVLQGDRDRLVPLAGLRQLPALQPGWEVHVLDGVGHVPQLEVPERTAALLLPWLDALPLDAASGSTDLLAAP